MELPTPLELEPRAPTESCPEGLRRPGGWAPSAQLAAGCVVPSLKDWRGSEPPSARPAARPRPLLPRRRRSPDVPLDARAPVPLFRDERRVRHKAEEMFDLVADVERYPEFVPLCRALKVRPRKTEPDGPETAGGEYDGWLQADQRDVHQPRHAGQAAHLQIRVEDLDGPFSRLENIWTFKDEAGGEASRVGFFIDYEFRSRTLSALMGSMFDVAFRKFASVFERRADVVYGRG